MPDVVELLRDLLRFDTTNPPGNEEACIAYVESLLHAQGIATERYEKTPGRPNLVARHPGSAGGPPLLLYGHVDVVSTAGQSWTHPPFAAELADGMIWGRGALDMKSGVALIVRAFLDAVAAGSPTPLVLLVLSDEESGGDQGAAFVADEHPGALRGAKHALGEFGGASQSVGGRRFYPIQVAEKQICWLRVRVRGNAGHAALGAKGSANVRLASVVEALERRQPPVRITPLVRAWFETTAAHLPRKERLAMRLLLNPRLADLAVRTIGQPIFGRVIRNTAAATIVRGGDKINVIPAEAELELDGRILPGQTPDDLIREVYEIVGRDGVEIELVRHDPGPPEPDMSKYALLADTIRVLDPEGIPVPILQAGVTDARHLARAGVQTYGFLPLKLPDGFEVAPLIHNADERVPADALQFGLDAISRVIAGYPSA